VDISAVDKNTLADRQGVTLGHYYGDDYAGAKQDFAVVRAGLISENKLFTEECIIPMTYCGVEMKNKAI